MVPQEGKCHLLRMWPAEGGRAHHLLQLRDLVGADDAEPGAPGITGLGRHQEDLLPAQAVACLPAQQT
ncbi:hypothetical protein LA343_05860 [Corynebacterium falsenii]|uniref:hypothetical protein n=1 Tax=Corynebacterium falsenii TaxID=108486 RepID=UPI001CCF8EDA|nr:hypothetical protein [Corynebacterium falsenii]UBI05643.1 hypothetical protein LA343_05860 [Corynebacterium falsenii]